MSQRLPGFFTQATAPALPTSSSTLSGNLAASQQALWGLLRQQYYERTWDAPSPAALSMCWRRRPSFDGPQRKVWVRLAEHDGLIYLDLADEFWRCVEIGANGWRIAEDPPGQIPPQRWHAATSFAGAGRIS
jgi:hypothetical protein